MFCSIIMPAYNAEATVKRAIKSVISQDLDKEDYEFILSDDGSEDNTIKVLEDMNPDINWSVIHKPDGVPNGPGNARQRGLAAAKGDYILFLDSDDLLYEDCLGKVKNTVLEAIKENPIKYFIFSFDEWDMNSEKSVKNYFQDMTWVHGKVYERQYLMDNAIAFKEDLFTHEDVYFNTKLGAKLFQDHINIYVDKTPIYKWILKPNSITRQLYDGHIYIEKYLEDYLISTIEPHLSIILQTDEELLDKDVRNFCLRQSILGLLHAYFYMQSFIYTQNLQGMIQENITVFKKYLDKVCDLFKITPQEIVQNVYNAPDIYMQVKANCFNGCYHFVELITFNEFILKFIPENANFLLNKDKESVLNENADNVVPFEKENKE